MPCEFQAPRNLKFRFNLLTISFLIIIPLLFSVSQAEARQQQRKFSLVDAGQNGSFNIGPAVGDVRRITDEDTDRDVLLLDYQIMNGSIIGIWTQSFPPELGPQMGDAVKIGVKVTDPNQLHEISVKAEIKGERFVQSVPLEIKEGWSFVRQPVNWNGIESLREIVFLVSPTDTSKTLNGVLYFDAVFYRLSFLEKNFIFIKIGLILLIGFLAGFAVNSLAKSSGLYNRQGRGFQAAGDKISGFDFKDSSFLSRIKQDFLYGFAAALTLAGSFGIYLIGMENFLDKGFRFNFIVVGLIGTFIAEILKFGIRGKHLTPVEVSKNIIFSGLLAASAGDLAVLQAPASWPQLLMLNKFIAIIAFIAYHISNFRSFASSGRHLRTVKGALIIGIPYLFNWLLLLENINMIESLINTLTLGIFNAWPIFIETIGRIIVIFLFNEAVVSAIGLAAKGRMLKMPKAHLFIFFVSVGVIIAPLIADLGSTKLVASLPDVAKALLSILAIMLAFGGLWGEVYLITGTALDGGRGKAPSWETVSGHIKAGTKKGMVYSGILTAILYALKFLLEANILQIVTKNLPIAAGVVSGGLIFPLLKTIIESFDGSLPFFERVRYSYRDISLYARGTIAGLGFAYAITHGIVRWMMPNRIMYGLIVGILASCGISVLRDALFALRKKGKIQSWRLYFVDALLGAFVGSGLAFYLDTLQVPVIIEKFKVYTSSNFSAKSYITYPLVNKWGRIDLGSYTGGVKLLFTESLAGVINWSIAAWLFAINKVFMQAFFEKHTKPIKFFFSKEGFAQLIEHMIYVLRWGLWMSPIIFTFLRMMPEPTWYNQDGAIRTLFAIYNNLTMSSAAFRDWSLKVFIYILAFDFFRVLIWMDHMGLRVATLVNLSFIGLDRFDERLARFIGPAAAQRYIPEAIKRFATWAPLLIPFYLPRGQDWDTVWNTAQAMQNASSGTDFIYSLKSLALPGMMLLMGTATIGFTAISFGVRSLRYRSRGKRIGSYELSNREYKVTIKENGEAYSEVIDKGIDISRRSYDIIDPCGRILFIADATKGQKSDRRYWPVIGNFPKEIFEASRIEKYENYLKVINENNGIITTAEVSLPDEDNTAELWKITIDNATYDERQLKIIPYLEWVLNGWMHDRFHTQYARLFTEVEYVSRANAVLSWNKSIKAMGFLATDVPPDGFLVSRMDFIGRGQSIWKPRVLETFDFRNARDTAPYPTFDPIGSLMVDVAINPRSSKTLNLLIGYSKNRESALKLIDLFLNPKPPKTVPDLKNEKKPFLIGHGEILPGTPKPYFKYIDNGNKILIYTPYTPRPYDHAMSNAIGHSVMVTNRGLHTSCNGNSQQNRLTPDWPDTVTKEIPSEAIYLYDPDNNEWYSPTYHPLNKEGVNNESEFGVDGTAVFRMRDNDISTELVVFVPPDDPLGIYLLTVKNNGDKARRMRIAPYFQMVLEFQPERSGTLKTRYDKARGALYFSNPRNIFRTGWAFASMTIPAECMETRRGRFFGKDRGTSRPFMVEKGTPDTAQLSDTRQIASLLGTVEIPAHSDVAIAVILGQADTRKEASLLVDKYKNIETVRNSLKGTRTWWLNLMSTLEVKTNQEEFDCLQNWLKYQSIAERIWARRGFYQTSGAFGFRDQLQDTVNLMWVDPALARKQIILHASQQFIEGDVFHWFFTRNDGRTAFSCRSHASDNPLWLAWGVVEYIKATGDYSILDEMTSYVVSEFPFADLPKNKAGWGHLYQRSTQGDSVYGHCLKAINLVMEKRMGKHGLPLIRTGDWNDGLDEIGSEGKGESVWLGFFLYYILKDMVNIIQKKEGVRCKAYYLKKMEDLKDSLERTWREDRYLRAIHDDGTEIGIKNSGVWEIDALTAAWAVMADINFERGVTVFHTALSILEKDNVVLLGWPALREDTKPYLGRSSKYPIGVRENGMYCHGVQWLIKAARLLAEKFEIDGNNANANEYRTIAYKLWLKITTISHVTPDQIEIYGGQPNKQPADILTNFDIGRMIWNGYTGAAGWMLREALEGVIGASLIDDRLILPSDLNKSRGALKVISVHRDIKKSPLSRPV